MSAEILRRAASLMRERAEAATDGPWVAEQGASGGWWIEAPHTATIAELDIDYSVPRADAEHIASWHPAVALAVADLFDQTAADWQLIDDGVLWTRAITWDATKHYCTALARAYLGEAS